MNATRCTILSIFSGKIWFVFRICSIFATANEKQTASQKKANPSEGG